MKISSLFPFSTPISASYFEHCRDTRAATMATLFFSLQEVQLFHLLPSLIQQASYDDFLALVAVFIASLAYVTKGLLWSRPDPYRYQLFERPQQQSDITSGPQRSRDLAERLKQENGEIAILWASQSGTTERLAGRLAKELCRSFGAKVLLADTSDIDPASCTRLSNDKTIIFMASTFGEGDPSDNMHEFWDWLNNTEAVPDLRFLAFGLGNSKYKHYNHVIDVLAERLNLRGAQMLMDIGKADDAAGETEEHFLEWKERVFELFERTLGYERKEAAYEPSLEIVEDASTGASELNVGVPSKGRSVAGQSKAYALPITQARELFKDSSDRNCLHMELDLGQHAIKYKTGDYLAVWPVNPTAEVDRILRLLGPEVDRAVPVHIKSVDDTPTKIPSPSTLEAIFGHYLEVCAPVSREHVATLASYGPTQPARDFLSSISADRTSYAEYLRTHYINLGRLLEAAHAKPGSWSKLPLSLVIEMLPAMQSRPYSISSSSVVSPRQMAITAVLADRALPSPSTERIPGLTTTYLMGNKRRVDTSTPINTPARTGLADGRIYASIGKSNFKLPTLASAPIIMVGAGTGIAPFRAFVQERARVKTMGRLVGSTRLFFGCRNQNQDFIYSDEFAGWGDTLGDSFSLTTAFSRPGDGSSGRYVQDAIHADAEQMVKLLIDENAYFYICGSAAMARDVSDAVAKIVMASQDWTEAQMKEFADRQKRSKRWLQDVWG